MTSVFPALVRGDTVIVKPSLRGPLTPVALASIATEVGGPDGVVNIVPGTGDALTGGHLASEVIGWAEDRCRTTPRTA